MISKFRKNIRVYLIVGAVAALAIFQFSGIGSDTVGANNTAQSLPFTQNWTNAGLITVDDDWSAVPGIVGYRGDDASTTAANIDPRTIVSDTFSTTVQVFANKDNPDTFTSGGTAEFDGIANPTIAFQGSGSADYPNAVLFVNATGQSNVRVQLNVRDIDGSADDTTQPFNVQYRVGATGDFINVAGGYFADVTTGGTATQVTPVDVTLPAAANNQALVQIRLMTTNSPGSDEWIGIDDINITAGGGGPTPTPRNKRADYDGDGKADVSVYRPSTGNWFIQASTAGFTAYTFGASTDKIVPGDYDGDGKTDYAVYRPSTGNWFIQGSTAGFSAFTFGASTDIPVPGYYDSDNKTDIAVYRPSTGIWYIQASTAGFSAYNFGAPTDRPVQGDYDGDGRTDIAVFRPSEGNWYIQRSTAGFQAVSFGAGTDVTVQSDFDGDGKTDVAVYRPSNGTWYIQGSMAGFSGFVFGASSDIAVPADYDGDGKADIAVFRPSEGNWYIQRSTAGFTASSFGASTDIPTPNRYILNQ